MFVCTNVHIEICLEVLRRTPDFLCRDSSQLSAYLIAYNVNNLKHA